MLTKNIHKLINSLKTKKGRDENGLFLAEGEKIVEEVAYSKFEVEYVLYTPKYEPLATKFKNRIEVSEKELKELSTLTTPQGVLAVLRTPSAELNSSLLSNELVLALDEVQDPGNLGTIIRIADWFNIRNIICNHGTADWTNPKVIQATMGSFLRVTIHYTNLGKYLKEQKKGNRVYGTLLEGENIYSQKLSRNGIIVLGNEGKGINKDLLPEITDRITIPSFGNPTESLNVAVAAAIVCSEFRRPR